ncbi:MAG: hypothetical protein LRZ85_10160 [Alphaproteobacteria bacterium]|nr:hypothetical protein [Alphaproteobacteria bacterium]MCD8519935.1 hypothetical protein [Alphaproteobacteria bacterium]MCD8525695.1 hypothetical protein [Alphaproteobacteria bacterium]MCD8570684.1 hypothetical protein [Alphaproteobacteria bacterium]
MRFQIFYFILCLTLLPAPALADAMHYTTLGAKKGQLSPPDLTIKSLNFKQDEAKRKADAAAQAGKEKTFEDVWERYRALAEGRITEEKAVQKQPEKPIKPKVIGAKRPSALPSKTIEPAATEYIERPLAETAESVKSRPMGILDKYEETKARRSQMKMIRLGRPAPETKPQAAAEPKNDLPAMAPAAGDEG